jgi:hypothetical protein
MKKLLYLSPEVIKPDTILFSDIHLDENKEFGKINPDTGLNTRFEEGLDILDQIISYIANHPFQIEEVKFLGDIFKLKDRIPNHMLVEFKKKLHILCQSVHFTGLLGNHDYNLLQYPFIDLFNNNWEDNLFITKAQTRVDKNLVMYGYIPYQRDMETFWELWKSIHNGSVKPNIILFHQELPGAIYNNNKKVPGILPDSIFDPNILYISGHLHIYQKTKNVLWIGSPYQVNFSDEGVKKYIWLLNSKTKQIAPLELKYPKFITININDPNPWEENKNSISGNYIRIIGETDISSYTNSYKKEVKEYLEQQGAKGISFQIKRIKPNQVTILSDSNIEDDSSIIQTYSKELISNNNLDIKKVIQTGTEIFYQG